MNNYWMIIVLLGSILLNGTLQAQDEKITTSTPFDSSLLLDYYLLDKALEQNNQYLENSIEQRLSFLQEQGLPKSTLRQFKQATQDWNEVFNSIHLDAQRNYNWNDPSSPYHIQTDLASPFEEVDIANLVGALEQLKTRQLAALKSLWKAKSKRGTLFTNPKTQEQEISNLKQEMTRLHQTIHYIDDREWQASTFNNRPSFLILILLRKVKNEALLQQILLVDYLDQQFVDLPLFRTGMDIEVSANKQEYLQGEKRELVIKTFPLVKNKVQIRVNGMLVRNYKGVATFKTQVISLGAQQDTITILYTDAETGRPQTIQKIIDYRVNKPNINIAAIKMNVLHLGMENPIVITTNLDIPRPLQVEARYQDCSEDCEIEITRQGNSYSDYYKLVPPRIGIVDVILKDTIDGGREYLYEFRVYPIVDPVFRLGRKEIGAMSKGELGAQIGISGWVFDQLFRYSFNPMVNHYKLTHESEGILKIYEHDQARFSKEIIKALRAAKAGDVYTFSEITCLYPYEKTPRIGNDIEITVK
ncbi:MAG: hypothetical protein ACRBFS_18915 [Aureispira sp.]